MLSVIVVTENDDLDKLVADINRASWDEANDLTKYSIEALSAYLNRQDNLFISCYDRTGQQAKLLGIASARLQLKPYDYDLWLYVDEVDVCVDARRRGVGKAMMRKLIEIAQDAGCEELWLGTEVDNLPAKSLYASLMPDEVDHVIGYTFYGSTHRDDSTA